MPAVAAAVVVLAVPRDDDEQAKWMALAATMMSFVASLVLVVSFDRSPGGVAGAPFQFASQGTWIDAAKAGFDVQFHMGVDGLGMVMVLLTTFLFVVATLISFGIKLRTKEYFFWLLALETGVLGVFTSLDLIMFFLFWEVELLPMYMLISVWGSGRKEYSAMKFVLYTVAGSAFMLVGFLAMGFSAGTFDMEQLTSADLSDPLISLHAIFFLILAAFAV